MTKLSIHLLGALQAKLDDKAVTDFSTDKVRALLTYLVVESNRPHRRDTLAGLLWPDYPQRKARQSLRTALSHLRQAIDDQDKSEPFIFVSRETLQFNTASDHWLDAAMFRFLAKECKVHRHRQKETCLPCTRRLIQMIELYRGDFLDQFFLSDSDVFEEWALLTREWFRQQVMEALFHVAHYHERRGEYAQAHEYAQRQVELEPWREESRRQLMWLLALDGQRSAALAQYETCCRVLAEELGVEPAAKTTALYERIRTEERLVRQVPLYDLPSLPTPFVGREAELTDLANRLSNPDCQLLTIVGSGGVGKTRLALRAAEDQAGLFAHGIAFVPLGSVGSPDLLAPAIANALNFSLQGREDPEEQLLDRLRDVEMLLVLDGMEHLLEGSGVLVDILRRAPGVILLVTSRERLSLQEEWVHVLEGLAYPVEESPGQNELGTFSAVELFRQRACQTDHRFFLSEINAPYVARICRLVEGMPLGVELAAAWTNDYSCEQVAQAIERNLDALTSPLRNVPERQRSVRATFDYSWSLLTDNEQRSFRKLSVFYGGFSQVAARQVAKVTPILLSALADKSLIRRENSNRYRVHELLRQFAMEKLTQSQEKAQIHDSLCRYYAKFLHQREEALEKKQDREALEEIEQEMGNIRPAWDWAVAQARWVEVGKSLRSLWFFFLIRGPFQVGETLLETAAGRLRTWLGEREQPELEATLLLARLLVAQTRFRNRLAQHDRAVETAQAAVRLAQQICDEGIEAAARVEWGESLWRKSEYDASRRQLEQALEKARAVGQRQVEAESLRHIGNTFFMVGSFEQALSYYQQAAHTCREIDERLGEVAALDNIANISTHLGRHKEAKTYYERTLHIYREIGDQLNQASVLVNLGELTRLSGDFSEALTYYKQSLRGFQAIGARSGEAIALLNLGMFLGYLGDYEQADAYCKQSLHIRREAGNRRGEAITLAALGLLSHHRGDDESALAYCRQALSISEELGDRLRQSRTLIRMGHAWLGLAQRARDAVQQSEHLAQATDAYRQALDIRRELDQTFLAVEVLAGLARVYLAQDDPARAMMHVEEILDFLKTSDTDSEHGLAGTTDPFGIYLTCCRVLQVAQDPRAQDTLNTAYNYLQQQAAKIDDVNLRRSFLENVAAHREIIALWENGQTAR